MAVLESMASGVPLVSTRVGMSNDLICDGVSGFLNEIEDADGLAVSAARLFSDRNLATSVSTTAARKAQCYDWMAIADRYHKEVYRPLLAQDGFRFSD